MAPRAGARCRRAPGRRHAPDAATPGDRPAETPDFEVQIRLDLEDLLAFAKIHAARFRTLHPSLVGRQRAWSLGVGAALAIVAAAAWTGLGQIEPTWQGLGLVAACVFTVHAIGYELNHRHGKARVKRVWEAATAGEGDRWTTLRIGAGGIAASNATERAFYTWSAIRDVGDEAGPLLMWLDERRAILLPRRFLPRPEMADALLRLARDRRGGNTRPG